VSVSSLAVTDDMNKSYTQESARWEVISCSLQAVCVSGIVPRSDSNVSVVGLVVPAAFATIVGTGERDANGIALDPAVASKVLKISRATAIILLFGYVK